MSLAQNTPEWLAKRKSFIGASDASAIMGVSPWKTAYTLWQEKLDLVNSPAMTDTMKRGHDLEEHGRRYFENVMKMSLSPKVVFSNKHYFMMASLDGITEDGKIACEIKCPGHADHEIAKEGEIPPKYIPQLQHQLAVTGLDKMYYVSYTTFDVAIVVVERDQAYINDMIEKERVFWEEHVLKFVPPNMSDKDFVQKDDKEFFDAVNHFKQMKLLFEEAEEALESSRDDLIRICNGKSSLGFGVKVTKTMRRGNIDYSLIDAIKDVDLDRYRKKPIETWRITECN